MKGFRYTPRPDSPTGTCPAERRPPRKPLRRELPVKNSLVASLAAAALVTACGTGGPANWSNSSGSVATSRDDALVYAVDSDNENVAIVDAQSEHVIAHVDV